VDSCYLHCSIFGINTTLRKGVQEIAEAFEKDTTTREMREKRLDLYYFK